MKILSMKALCAKCMHDFHQGQCPVDAGTSDACTCDYDPCPGFKFTLQPVCKPLTVEDIGKETP